MPGHSDDTRFGSDVAGKVFVSEADPQATLLRRLYFESFTVATAELKRQHDRTEDEAPRKIPVTEKEARRSTFARRLEPGIRMVGELGPSCALMDAACRQAEGNQLVYLEWQACTKRELVAAAAAVARIAARAGPAEAAQRRMQKSRRRPGGRRPRVARSRS